MCWVFQRIKKNKLLSIVFLIAIIVRFVGLVPNIAHTDELYIIDHSRLLLYNILLSGDFDPYVYKYGSTIFYLQIIPLLPFLLAGFILIITGFANPPPSGFGHPFIDFIEQARDLFPVIPLWVGRALTATVGVLSIGIIFKIGKQLFGYGVGILSAFALAVNPFHVRDSHYITTDVLFIFMILVAFWSMVNIFQTSRLKWYILSGLFIGISSTVRYFPLALIIYPIAVLMDSHKDKSWLFKLILGLVAIPLGVFIGMPFVFFNPESRDILNQDVQMQLQWYGTSITAFLSSAVVFFATMGKTEFPLWSELLPTEYTPFHSSFLILRVFGIPFMIIAFLGLVIGFLKYPLKTLFVSFIPIAAFFYISFYVPAVYERLSLPIVPFIVLFGAVSLNWIWNYIKKTSFANWRRFLIAGAIGYFIFYHSVSATFASSISCGKESFDTQALNWVEETIPENTKLAKVSPIRLPEPFSSVGYEVVPDTDFSFSELQDQGIEYLFINSGSFIRLVYQFENNFFQPDNVLYENYFIPLMLREYQTRAKLINYGARHPWCDQAQFFYYQIPKQQIVEQPTLFSFSFSDNKDLEFWQIEEMNNKYSLITMDVNTQFGHSSNGALEYQWERVYYRGARVLSPKIPIKSGNLYTFSGWIKPDVDIESNQRDGFLRIDFYSDENTDVRLPGDIVALSSRIYGQSRWYYAKVSVEAPQNARFAVFSINVMGTRSRGSLFFDDLEILGQSSAN